MAKRTKAQKRAKVVKVIETFTKLASGLVKVWIRDQHWIVKVDQAEEFVLAKLKEIAAR